MKSFEEFMLKGKGSVPRISIWREGRIAFSVGFVNKFSLKDSRYVILFFDKETKRIGIKFTFNMNKESTIKVYKTKAHACWFNAKIFCDHYKIDYPRQLKDFEFNEEENFCVVSL